MMGVTAYDRVELRECCVQSGKLHSQNCPNSMLRTTLTLVFIYCSYESAIPFRPYVFIYRVLLKDADALWARVSRNKTRKMSTSTCVRKHLICELYLKEYRYDVFSCSVLMCGQGLLVIGRPACLATSAYGQPLPRFPLAWSARPTGRCTTGTNVVLAWWCSCTF
jgi:hypothetical protein